MNIKEIQQNAGDSALTLGAAAGGMVLGNLAVKKGASLPYIGKYAPYITAGLGFIAMATTKGKTQIMAVTATGIAAFHIINKAVANVALPEFASEALRLGNPVAGAVEFQTYGFPGIGNAMDPLATQNEPASGGFVTY